MCLLLLLLPATIKSQFIEISHDLIRVGDDVTLRCLNVDAEDTEDVANYVWYLNSEWLKTHFFIDFSLPSPHNPRRDLFHFSPFFSSCFFHSISSAKLQKLPRCQPDKKVINNEHFALRDNELLIRSAVKHLSGYYSCVVQFMNSGAKLETPHELITIVGEYNMC